MTEVTEFETEFLQNFLDDILNSDFIDEAVNIALKFNLDSNVEPTKVIESDDERVKDDVDRTKTIKCRKHKLSDGDLVNEIERNKERRSKSPNIDILKRAVKRLKNENKSIDVSDNSSSGIASTSNDLAGIETKPQPHRIQRNGKATSQCRLDDQHPHLQQVVSDILEGFKVMIIMRGPPGCGKSFLAQQIVDATTKDCWSNHIFSASDFFYDRDGCFHFNPLHVRTSHQWNQKRINAHARKAWSPIIVDNTNIKQWEMIDYFMTAVQNGYLVEIVQPNTPWSKSAGALAAMNIHDVPKATIERMMLNYESATVDDLMKQVGLKYTMEMPQYRSLPTLL